MTAGSIAENGTVERLDFTRNWPVFISILAALLLLGLSRFPAALQALAIGESGPAEMWTALLYAAAAMLAIWAAIKASGWRRAHLWLWGILCILLFGEETSWLQHQIGYATPEWFAAFNVQGEVNLHNLRGVHGGKLLEEETYSPVLGKLLGAQNLFQIGFLGYFLMLPLLSAVLPILRSSRMIDLPVAGPRLVLSIWIPIGAAIVLAFISDGATKTAAAEIREMLYAVAILVFIYLLAAPRRAAS